MKTKISRRYLPVATWGALGLLWLTSIFYFSLALDVRLRMEKAIAGSRQFAEYERENVDNYIFRKKLYFTPEMAAFMYNGSRLYLYINDSIFKQANIENLSITVTRDCYGEIYREEYNYDRFEPVQEVLARPGYRGFLISNVRVFTDYNEMTFMIRGVELPSPQHDVIILQTFSLMKRTVLFWEYLFRGIVFVFFGGLLFAILKTNRNWKC